MCTDRVVHTYTSYVMHHIVFPTTNNTSAKRTVQGFPTHKVDFSSLGISKMHTRILLRYRNMSDPPPLPKDQQLIMQSSPALYILRTCTVPCILVFWQYFEHVASQHLVTVEQPTVCSYNQFMLLLGFSFTTLPPGRGRH